MGTTTCDGCTTEGVTALLKGEPVVGYPYGVPCATNVLDRAGSTEFGSGGSARFDGELNGGQNDEEEAMIGGCFHAPLNNQLKGGTLNWQGDEPGSQNLCVWTGKMTLCLPTNVKLVRWLVILTS